MSEPKPHPKVILDKISIFAVIFVVVLIIYIIKMTSYGSNSRTSSIINKASVISTDQSASPTMDSWRTSFMKSCMQYSKISAYCDCTYNYMTARYTMKQMYEMGESSTVLKQLISDAAAACKSTVTPTNAIDHPTDTPIQVAPAKTSFGDGMYEVGKDIQPGTYKTNGEPGYSCVWQRLSGFSGSENEIIDENTVNGTAIVTIESTDKGFESHYCGTWIKE